MYNYHKKFRLLICMTLLFAVHDTSAQVRLPQIIRDSMILQRDAPARIWGWASAGETIRLSFRGKTLRTTASKSGEWEIFLPPTPAGGPYNILIRGKNSHTLSDVLFGDVWFFSGQSNMVHQMNIHDVAYAKDIATADFPQIRQFLIPVANDLQQQRSDLPSGTWNAAVGENLRPFSVVAWFFARKLHQQYSIPIGIINASVGGSPAQAWISENGLEGFSSLQEVIRKNKDSAYIAQLQAGSRMPPGRGMAEDAGLQASPSWFSKEYEPKGWRRINIPGFWEDQGLRNLNGTLWYRRLIDIPASMQGKPARIFMGRIVDADELYINGVRIGNTTYQYPQRRYTIPANVLTSGKNLIVIRVTNHGGKGGFVPDKPYYLFSGTDTVDLKGDWMYKVGEVFRPERNSGSFGFSAQNQPAALYNAMVAPITPYTIKGINWYQGESDAGRPDQYAALMQALISDWRNQWNNDSLPFLYVQLPGFMEYNYLPEESNWALLREAQLQTLQVPHTAMAVAIDVGEWNDIHPGNKHIIGQRLARAALNLVYKENILPGGPLFRQATIEGDSITISFAITGSGLKTSDGEAPGSFAVAGMDKKFVWAKTRIDGDKVVVWNEEIDEPRYVRYAWADNPVQANLVNAEGLPASPFRTDQ